MHILQVPPHIKIWCTLVRRTWELFKSSTKFASATDFPVLVPPFLIDTLWSTAELIRPLHWDLNFDFECLRAVRCTCTKWHWKLVQSLLASHVFDIFEKNQMMSNGFPRTCHELSTFWLGYETGLSVLALLHSHIQLMLESVLSLYFPAVMMLEVMYQTSLTSKRSSINPVPR